MDRIADAGNPECQGQVATHLSRSGWRRAMTGMGQILPFERGGDGGGSGSVNEPARGRGAGVAVGAISER
jgi:hypothetical protein